MTLTMLRCFIFVVLIHSSFANPALIQLTEPVDHGEGPVYDDRTGRVYFVDMFNGRLNSFNIETGELNFFELDGDLTLALPSERSENRLVISLGRAVAEVEWDGSSNNVTSFEVLTYVDETRPQNRLNDGKADKEGRLWLGTMGPEINGEIVDVDSGSLYFITNENLANPEVVVHPVNISNGMGWNYANDKFYFIDTTSGEVTEFDYDNDSGAISNARVIFDVDDFSDTLAGRPDGMTVDLDGNLWVALYGGGSIIKVDPTNGQVLQRIAMPALYTTSVCWGGPNYDSLYVTTSRYLLNEEERKQQPAAGSLFAIKNLDTYGFTSYRATVTYP